MGSRLTLMNKLGSLFRIEHKDGDPALTIDAKDIQLKSELLTTVNPVTNAAIAAAVEEYRQSQLKVPDKALSSLHNLWYFLKDGVAYTATGSSSTYDNEGTGRYSDGDTAIYSIEGLSPVPIPSDYSIVDIGGNGHSIVWALDLNGDLYCWGANDYGVVGDGTTTPVTYPKLILSNVEHVYPNLHLGYSVDYASMFVRMKDGSIMCWGLNSTDGGILGLGFLSSHVTAPTVCSALGTNVRQLWNYGGYLGVCIVQLYDGSLWYSGNTNTGSMGTGSAAREGSGGNWIDITTQWKADTYGEIEHIYWTTSWMDVSNGINLQSSMYVRFKSGHVMASGNSYYGQMGLENTNNVTVPRLLAENIVDMDVTGCIGTVKLLYDDGTMSIFGYGGRGQVGNGLGVAINYMGSSVVDDTTKLLTKQLNNHFIGYFLCTYIERTINGVKSYWVAGHSSRGQVGTGKIGAEVEFTRILFPNGIELDDIYATSSAGGENSLLAITTDGRWFVWGNNAQNLLSTDTTLNILVPTEITPGTFKAKP